MGLPGAAPVAGPDVGVEEGSGCTVDLAGAAGVGTAGVGTGLAAGAGAAAGAGGLVCIAGVSWMGWAGADERLSCRGCSRSRRSGSPGAELRIHKPFMGHPM